MINTPKPQEVVQAARFEVVDREGNARIVLGLKNGTMPSFELLRADGGIGVSIELGADQTSSITVRDQKGRVRINIRLHDSDGEGDGEYPSISLMGSDTVPHVC